MSASGGLLERLQRQRRKYGLSAYLRRAAGKSLDRVLYRVDRRAIAAALQRVGLRRGAVVCVHSALSRLGYVAGGGDALIDVLMDSVGPEGCVLMPTFSTGAAMASYVQSGEVFDVRRTPSQVGAITEAFRTRPGVLRSAHPTNSLAAWGGDAEALLRDHEKSPTPYGPDTPYGRVAERDDSCILMLETHIHSLLHHLQERVEFPNLFLPEPATAWIVDASGARREVSTRLMRPRVPYFIAVPPAEGDAPDWVVLHDFALMFPRRRPGELERRGARFPGYPPIYSRRAELEASGVLKATRLGKGEIGLLNVRGFLARVEPELRELIERFREHYVPERLSNLEYY